MCGSFTCSKNTLVGLNVIYILVSFLMIGVAVHGKHLVDMSFFMDISGKVSGIVTSLPIVGGITACGIFLLMISVIGLIGAVRHHQVSDLFDNAVFAFSHFHLQVLLFFYMVVLFLIFLIQVKEMCNACLVRFFSEPFLNC